VTSPAAQHTDAALGADPSRVIARLFLPAEERPAERSRAGAVVERVRALTELEVQRRAAQVLSDFSARHRTTRRCFVITQRSSGRTCRTPLT
jgi:hypothetical protein